MSPTPRQLNILRFIAGYQAKYDGRTPSMSTIASGLGMFGKSNVHRAIACLEERGLILRRNANRTIVLLTDVVFPCAPDGEPLFVAKVVPLLVGAAR